MSIGKALKKAVKSVSKAVVGGAPGLLDAVSGGANTAGAQAIASNLGFGNVVSGVVGLGTDYLQSQINLNAQKQLASHTAKEQNALNELAYQRNLQQWNLENAYNSPAEQMKRFEAAGLNKNLIYGQQNTSSNSPTLQPATYDPGQYHPVDKSSQRQALQLALMEHKQRIENQAIENDLARQRLVLAEREANRSDLLTAAQIKTMNANLGLTGSMNDYNIGLRKDTLAWNKYQDALKSWETRAKNLPWFIRGDDRKASQYLGRKPIYMDFLE